MADIPIKYGKFKDTDGVVKKAYFVNTEKAIYDNDNQPLDQKLIGMKNTINSLQETIVGLQNSIAKLNSDLDAAEATIEVTKNNIIYRDVNFDSETINIPGGGFVYKEINSLPSVPGYQIIAVSLLNANGTSNGNCQYQARLKSNAICIFNPTNTTATITYLRFRFLLSKG